MDLAPTPGERELLVGREMLVAEADHQIIQQGGADFRQHLIGHVLRQIDAGDIGAERSGELWTSGGGNCVLRGAFISRFS